jgi:CDP-paratose 2-epimerase
VKRGLRDHFWCSAAELLQETWNGHRHGFLAYLMKCAVTEAPYTIFGYGRKQVRDNIHSADLIRAFDEFFREPRVGEVYNIGGGRHSNCSMLEAIVLCEQITGRQFHWKYVDENRRGDHIWWISDLTRFQEHYPSWKLQYDVPQILKEIYDKNVERWNEECLAQAEGQHVSPR